MTSVALPEPVQAVPAYSADPDVGLAAAGDRRAFERLYRLHVARVFSLCARMVNGRTRAEELTQDVFVRAWEKLYLFRDESAFGTWLHRLTVNVVLNDRKTEGRQRSRFEDDEEGDAIEHLPGRPHAPGDRMDRAICGATSPNVSMRASFRWRRRGWRAALRRAGHGCVLPPPRRRQDAAMS